MNPSLPLARRMHGMKRSTVRELLKLTSKPDVISFAGGLPSPDLFPVDAIREAADKVLRTNGSSSLQYSETEGLADLRDMVAARFSAAGIEVDRENVLITSGSQQALDLLGRVFLDPGDHVWVENPTYLALLSAWRPCEPEFVAVASDADGMQIELLESQVAPCAKLLYLVPNFQNPQGTTLNFDRRLRLVEILRKIGTFVIEDNPYGELRFEGDPLPDLLALQARIGPCDVNVGRVIHVGTFSKVLAPGLRVGWIVAPAHVIDPLVKAKQAADLHTSTLNQRVIVECLRSGMLPGQLVRLRNAYREKRDVMLASLARWFPKDATWTHPQGGMFLMVTLPPGLDAGVLLQEALLRRVAFVPGEDFHLEGAGKNTLRLNYSYCSPELIRTGIQRLGEALDACLSQVA